MPLNSLDEISSITIKGEQIMTDTIEHNDNATLVIGSSVLTFARYQAVAGTTAIYPGAGDPDSVQGLAYATLGLSGEAGELCNKVKKILRDNNGVISEQVRDDLAKELGDCVWYVAALASQLNIPMETIARRNLEKLLDRKDRGVLGGSGDNR